MGANPGGGGQGDIPPPPTHTLFSGWMVIYLNYAPFYIFFNVVALFLLLLVTKVCDVGWVPLLCVWKIEQQILSRKTSVGVPPPPLPLSASDWRYCLPPPPPLRLSC